MGEGSAVRCIGTASSIITAGLFTGLFESLRLSPVKLSCKVYSPRSLHYK